MIYKYVEIEHSFTKHNGDIFRGFGIYQIILDTNVFEIEFNFRPDDLNDGYEIELLYRLNGTYENPKIDNVFKLYRTLTHIYHTKFKEIYPQLNKPAHFKIKGVTGKFMNFERDFRKDKIAEYYIKKCLNIKNSYYDFENNLILDLDN
jgi:hypothetical protein